MPSQFDSANSAHSRPQVPTILVRDPRARPRVTIGIPAYNAAPFIGRTLESFQEQSFGDLEIIVSDNASTDDTAEIVRSYAERDARIRFDRCDRNVGGARNYNRLVGMSRAPYFRWAAADDLSAPTSVERCLELLERDASVALVYPKTRIIDAAGAPIRDYDDNMHLVDASPARRLSQYLDRLGLCNMIYGLMRTDELRRTRLLGSYGGADYVFQAEIVLRGKIWEVPERLFMRRFHEAASSAMNAEELAAFYNPDARKRPQLREWRHLGEHTLNVLLSPLPLVERLRSLAVLARNARQSRDKYGRELLLMSRYLLSGARPARHH